VLGNIGKKYQAAVMQLDEGRGCRTSFLQQKYPSYTLPFFGLFVPMSKLNFQWSSRRIFQKQSDDTGMENRPLVQTATSRLNPLELQSKR
jgi:hypothetical protein